MWWKVIGALLILMAPLVVLGGLVGPRTKHPPGSAEAVGAMMADITCPLMPLLLGAALVWIGIRQERAARRRDRDADRRWGRDRRAD
jgi:hypothetical protein